MAHINVYAEDFDNIEVTVVEKKGFTGVKVESVDNRTGDPYQAITLWGFNRERLVRDLELILSVAKNAVPVGKTESKQLKPSGVLGE